MPGEEDDELRGLVGYEQRLHKLRYVKLLTEAERVGAEIFPDITRPELIRRILERQGIDDDVLASPPGESDPEEERNE
jgi:hypothetical protein